MSKKLLVMTEEKWQRFAPPEQDRSNTYIKVSEFRAAMTEVDAKQLYAWVHAYDLAWLKWHADNERFGDMTAEPQWNDYLLAHIKEGK